MFREESFLLGTITRTHGVNGELVLLFKNESSLDYEHLESVFVELDGKLVPFFIDSYRTKGDSTALIGFERYNSEQETIFLKGSSVYAHLDEKIEYDTDNSDINTLIGYSIFEDGKLIGKIEDILKFPNNIQFEITIEGNKILIPANQELINNIDSDKKTIEMNLPEGLLDIN